MSIRAVLVGVEHVSGRGGVVLDAESDVWLTYSLEEIAGPRLDDCRPALAKSDWKMSER